MLARSEISSAVGTSYFEGSTTHGRIHDAGPVKLAPEEGRGRTGNTVSNFSTTTIYYLVSCVSGTSPLGVVVVVLTLADREKYNPWFLDRLKNQE